MKVESIEYHKTSFSQTGQMFLYCSISLFSYIKLCEVIFPAVTLFFYANDKKLLKISQDDSNIQYFHSL